ncbi:hypothetical protein ACU635_14775 [[Actinomadura] parvosata]|uniref:Uncharacterized protein n=1 Tax=Nonomuraea composti TaxID=2720023 RepID=A0ABX1BME4_9ACTN|nr:hypothetical protein [Nonomuraea sp. FMUSA5-5]NJP96961.1 hypothetical protein [Nonomuraea sp. FMUSA5-5]
MATWIAGSYAALVVLLGLAGWLASRSGVPDVFVMAQTVMTLPLSYLVSLTSLSGIAWMLAIDVAGLVQAGVLWVILGGLRT